MSFIVCQHFIHPLSSLNPFLLIKEYGTNKGKNIGRTSYFSGEFILLIHEKLIRVACGDNPQILMITCRPLITPNQPSNANNLKFLKAIVTEIVSVIQQNVRDITETGRLSGIKLI